MPIVVAEHLPWMIGETVPELRAELPEGTPVIKKDVYNTWHDPRFAGAVRETGREPLVFCGIETHVCMGLPTLEAVQRGYKTFVAVDCTGAQVTVDRDTAFLRFWQAGVTPTTWNTLIFENLQRIVLEWRLAGHRPFKAGDRDLAGSAPTRRAPIPIHADCRPGS